MSVRTRDFTFLNVFFGVILGIKNIFIILGPPLQHMR